MTPQKKHSKDGRRLQFCHCGKLGIYCAWGAYFCSDHRHQANSVARKPKIPDGCYGKKTGWLPAKQFADRMRRKPTQAEEQFMNALLEVFRGYATRPASQITIGRYVVDFKVGNLIIEVDGFSHLLRKEQDQKRTTFLLNRGFRIMRLQNGQVYHDAKQLAQEVFRQTGPHRVGYVKVDADDYFA